MQGQILNGGLFLLSQRNHTFFMTFTAVIFIPDIVRQNVNSLTITVHYTHSQKKCLSCSFA